MSNEYSRIAIVTGATSGIGEATARKFIESGLGVVGNGRNSEKLAQLEKELGPAFCGVAGDASEEAVLESLFIAAQDHFNQPVSIVIANAGRGLGGSVTTAPVSEFEELLKINVTGALRLLQKAAQKMLETQPDTFPEKAADIIVVGSVVGRHVSPFSAVYGSSKFAVHSLTEGLRREVGPKGIRVTLVEPGIVISGFQDVAGYSDELVNKLKTNFGPVLVGDDIANAVHFVVSQPAHVHISDIVVRPTRQDYP